MTRVIAGLARGRRLAVPPGQGTRPTSDRAREGLFSALVALAGPLDGCRVLDLYAGSGAVGLEALSRGAVEALLVEADARAARTIRANAATVGLPGAQVRQGRVERMAVEANADAPYQLAFLDPPYVIGDETVCAVLAGLVANGWLAPDAVAVVERPTRGGEFQWPTGYDTLRSRRYGEGTLWYGSVRGAAGEDQ